LRVRTVHEGSRARAARLIKLRAATVLATGLGFAALAAPAQAQDRVYSGPGTDWTTPANWTGGNPVDNAAETAVFQNNAAPLTINIASAVQANGVRYDAGAQSRTINLSSFLALYGTGIANNSGNIQAITINGIQASTSLQLAGSSDITGTQTDINLTSGFMQIAQTSNATRAHAILGVNGILSVETSDGTATLGGLSGNGTVRGAQQNGGIASQQLTVGGLNLSSIFGGLFQDAFGATLSIVKAGTGTLTLTGSNTNAGTTTISAGALQIGNGGTTGSLGSGNVVDNASLIFNRSNAFTFANPISGTGTVAQNGAGILRLSGANSYSGGTTINSGVLELGSATALGSGALTFAAGGTVRTAGSSSTVNGVTISAGASATLAAAVGDTLTLTGSLQMANAAGTQLHFGAAGQTGTVFANFASVGFIPNAGSVSIDAGTLRQNGNLGLFLLNVNGGLNIASGGTYDISGQTGAGVNLTGSGTITNNGPGAAQFQAQQTGTTTFGGTIQDGSAETGLVVRGGGTFVLTGASTYSGPTTFFGGTLQLGNGGTTGSIGNGSIDLTNGRLAFNRSDNVTFANTLSGSGSLAQSGSGILRLTGANTFSGGTTLNAGTIELGSTNALGTGGLTFAANGTIRTAAGTSATINGVTISAGASATLAAGAGDTLTLTGALQMANAAGTQLHFGTAGQTGTVFANFGSVGFIPNSGSVSIDAGTLRQNSNLGLFLLNVNGGLNIASGATYDISGQVGAGVNLTGSGTITNNGPGASQFQAQQTGTTTFAGTIQDGSATTGLVVRGGGTFVLTGANSYSGPTTFFGGTLQLGNGGTTGSIGNGSIDLTNGRLAFNRSDNVTFANTLSGSGSLAQSGSGILRLTGANTFSGGTTLNAGTIELGSANALGTGSLTFAASGTARTAAGTSATINGVTISAGASATLAAGAGDTLTLTGALQMANAAGTQLHVGTAGQTGTVFANFGSVGFIPNAGIVSIDAGTLRQNANMALFLLNVNGGLNIASGGTYDISGQTGAGVNLTGSGTITNNGPAAAQFQAQQTGTTTFGGSIQDGTQATSLLVRGGGTFIVTGANTYSGATTFSANSTLQIGNGGTTGSLGGGDIDLTNGKLVVNRSGSITLGGAISGTGTLTQAGSGTLRLTGANSYSGGTAINAGTIEVGSDNALGTGTATFGGGGLRAISGVTLANTMNVLANSDTRISAASGQVLTLTGPFGLTGVQPGLTTILRFGSATDTGRIDFDAQNAGTFISGGVGAFSMTVEGGTLRDVAGILSFFTRNAASVRVDAGATLDYSLLTGSLATIGTLTGAGTIVAPNLGVSQVRINAGDFAGSIIGNGGLNKVTAGTLILTGTNSYAGTTTIAGTLQIGNGGAGGTIGTGTIVDNGTLIFNTSADGRAGLIVGAGNVIQAGTGRLVLDGVNSSGNDFTGHIDVNAGTLLINGSVGDTTNGLADLTVHSGGTLGGNGTFYGDLTVVSGVVSPGNSPGTLTIAGDATFDAGTVFNYELSQPGVVGGAGNDLINVGGNLTLDGTLNVIPLPGFGAGYYRLFNYGGTLTDNGLAFGSIPAGFTPTLLTSIAGQVNLLFGDGSAQIIQYWDGFDHTGAFATPTGDGGSDIWNSTTTNWTVPPGWNFNDQWRGQAGVFAGTIGGVVQVQGTQSFQELRFQQDGYTLTGAGSLATTGGFSIIDVNAGDNVGISVNIGGSGGLTKSGDGTLQLNGSNTFGGTTMVAGGTLVLGGVATLSGGVLNNATFANFGTVSGLVVNNGTLTSSGALSGGLNNAGQATVSGQLIGAVTNSGTLTLNGPMSGIGAFTQTAAGATTLTSNISFGSLAGAGSIDLGTTGALAVGADNSSTSFAGAISGGTSSTVTKNGTGTLSLTGASTYNGLTFINSGVVNISNAAALGSTTQGTLVFSGAELQIQGGLTIGAENLSISGTGVAGGGALRNISGDNSMASVISLNPATVRIGSDAGTLTLSGVILGNNAALSVAGDGNVTMSGAIGNITSLTREAGIGTLLLSGANTFTGPTFVNQGVLQVQGGQALSDTAGVTVGAAGFLQLLSSETVGSIAGAGLIRFTGVTLTAGGDNSSTAFTGALQGTGGNLTKVGTGTLTLSGVNSYTGLTTISGGTLSLSGGAAIADTGAVQVNAGATLNLASSETIGSLGGAGGSFVTLGANSLTAGGNDGSTAFLGAISGTGGLTKTGTGTLTLGGANSYTGLTTISGGTLSLSGGAAIADTGAVLVNSGATLNLASSETIGSLSGLSGSFVTLGANTLTAGGDNSTTSFGGVISGSGGLSKVGTGGLILAGDNSYTGYTGTTTITGGIVQLGNGGTAGSIAGNIVDNGMLIVNRSNALTLAGNISGTGALVQAGTGTTTLTGTNSYSGGTLVSAGRLVGNSASLQGNIQDNAALEFNQATNGIYAGRIQGSGTLDKSGAGLLELTGDNSLLLGATNVRAGELRVTGLLSRSAATVLSGATLSGIGTVGGLTVQSGGTVSPGAGGLGALGVAGNVQLLTGATYAVQLQAPSGADMILATGTAQVAGTLALSNLGGTYAFNSSYLILQATGGRTGTFDTVNGLTAFGILYRPELVYNGTQVLVRLAPNTLANILGTTALTPNERSVQQRVDAAVAGGFNPQPLFAIYNLSQAQIPGALDQISGEIYATAAGTALDQDRLVREAVLGRLSGAAAMGRESAEAAQGVGAWGQAIGSWGGGDGDGNASEFETDRQGGIVGVDFGGAGDGGSWRAGLFGQYLKSNVDVAALGSHAEVEQTGGGAYLGINRGQFSASFGASYTNVDMSVRRTVAILSETNRGETDGEAYQGFAELSYAIPSGRWTFRPFVSGHIGSFKLDALTETGGGSALSVGRQSYTSATAEAGLEAAANIDRLRLSASLAGRAQLGDRDPNALIALAAAPGQSFTILGTQLDDFALAARLDATLHLGRAVDLSVGYSGLVGANTRDHAARATLSVRF
jgi:fibronectin-binding autotransporter adhesin